MYKKMYIHIIEAKAKEEKEIPSITGFGVRRNMRKIGMNIGGSIVGVLKVGKDK